MNLRELLSPLLFFYLQIAVPPGPSLQKGVAPAPGHMCTGDLVNKASRSALSAMSKTVTFVYIIKYLSSARTPRALVRRGQ
jgi:hypothetical protein